MGSKCPTIAGWPVILFGSAVRYTRLAIFRYGLRWFFDAVRAIMPPRLHAWLRRVLVER